NLTVTAAPRAGKGDGHANVDYIDAFDTDLGTVNVDGDVRHIDAGFSLGTTPGQGMKSFTALSMGISTPATSTVDESLLMNVASFTVKGDAYDTDLSFHGGVKSVSIGGNFEGFKASVARLYVDGDLGSLKIGGSAIQRIGTDPLIQVIG